MSNKMAVSYPKDVSATIAPLLVSVLEEQKQWDEKNVCIYVHMYETL